MSQKEKENTKEEDIASKVQPDNKEEKENTQKESDKKKEEEKKDNAESDKETESTCSEETDKAEVEAENPEDEAKKAVEAANAEAADWKDKYLRLSAEFDNYRKRTMKEKAELILNGGEKSIVSILPVVDDLERALKTMDKAEDVDAVKNGIDLIYKKFVDILGRNGVKAIDTDGKELDTDFHEAIATIPAPKEEQKGKIIDCVQTGYILNEKVIRHAKVVVGQ